MIDTKELIRVLGFIHEYFENHADEQEPDARKELFMDWSKVVLETIDILKTQEPHLLTLKEIQHTDAVWLETHGWQIQGGDIHETVLRRMSDFEDYVTEFADNDDGDITCDNSKLGIDWRCWSSEPTPKQRQEAKWE